MLKQKLEDENKIIHYLSFDSIEEVLKYIETTPPAWKKLQSRATEQHRVNFTQTKDLDEAIELCRFSKFEDSKELFKINQNLNFEVPNYLNKRKTVLSNYGFRPDVPKNIIGHPNQMHRIVRDESRKFINIYFNIAESGSKSKGQIYNKGILTLKLVEFLEKMNYRVNFNLFELSYNEIMSGREYFYTKTNVKNFNEKLDPNICYFPICHPSFLRRINFAIIETLGDEFESRLWSGNYGKVPDEKSVSEILKLSDNDILINHCSELGVNGYDLYADAQNFMNSINLNRYTEDTGEFVFNEQSKKFVLKMNKKR